MARDRSSKRNDPVEAADPAEELRAVREILFGAQVRELEALRKETDERLGAAIAQLGEKLTETIDELRQQFQKDLFELTERLGVETADRSRQGRELEQALQDARADLSRQLQDAARELREELRRKHETALRRLGEESAALSEAKADRSAVAELLSKMASELRDGSGVSEDS